MLNVNGILKAILKDITEGSEVIRVIDDQHFIDTMTGVEFHLYNGYYDYFQMTRDGEKPVSISSFTPEEAKTVMEIKEAITDPQTALDKKENYEMHLMQDRERFSSWFENPKPAKEFFQAKIETEEDVEEYVRR